jgi:hypothetical protein
MNGCVSAARMSAFAGKWYSTAVFVMPSCSAISRIDVR